MKTDHGTCLKPLIHLISDDQEQTSRLNKALTTNGFNVKTFSSTADTFLTSPSSTTPLPSTAIIDLLQHHNNHLKADIFSYLEFCKAKGIPVLIASDLNTLQAKLDALRAGASRYLIKPLDVTHVINLLDELTHHQPLEAYRILLVAGAANAFEACAASLRGTCFQVKTLSEPIKTLDIISLFDPDVVVLDVETPEITGPELAAILHESDPHLPVLLITDKPDINQQLLSLNLSGGDCLTRPLDTKHLISTITARAKQARCHHSTHQHLQSIIYENERKHLALNHHAIVSIADAAGDIIYVNDKFCEVSGYSREELLGNNHRIVKSNMHEAEFYQDLWKTISCGELWQSTICNRRKDGSYYWVASTITPFMDTNGKPYQYVSIRTDITPIKEAERQVQASKERLRQGQNFANIGTWDWNVKTGDLVWSERIGPLFGYKLGELETSYENFLNAVHPDDREAVINAVNATIETDAPYDIEHRVVWPDGTVRWLLERGAVTRDDNNMPLHMLGVVQDIDNRKRTEQALSESEQRLREAQQLSHIGNWTANIQTGELIWSDEIYQIFGYEPDAFEPSIEAFKAMLHPDDVQLVEDSERESSVTGKHDVTHRIILPDGRVRYVHELAIAETDDNGQLLQLTGTVQDVTELTLIQIEVENQRTLLEMLHQSSTNFVERSDFRSTVNDMLDMLLKLTKSEYGFTGEVLYDENDAPYLKTHAITNIAWNSESQKLYDEFAEKGFIFSNLNTLFGQVITGRKAIISNSPKTDPRSGGLPKGHPDMHSFLGVPIFYGDELIGVYAIANRKQGYDDDLLKFLSPFNVTYGVIIHSKRAQETETNIKLELLTAKEAAETANYAKSQFLSSMSHELRTPMNAILGFSQLLEYDKSLTDDSQENVDEIMKAGHHLLELINEVLDLAKIESGEINLLIQPVSIAFIVNDCLSLMSALATKNKINISVSEMNDLYVLADNTRLKQVLLNLLSNAIKYNRINGNIDIQWRAIGDFLHLDVIDTGTGIASEKITELFKPFNRLGAENTTIEGTGIGLTITQSIIELMHGKVGVISKSGEGSTFWIELPLSLENNINKNDIPQYTYNTSQKTENKMKSKCILYIEDNKANIKLVEQILNLNNEITFYSAHTPQLGIDLADVYQPDIILLDINMTGMNGYQVLEVIRNNPNLRNIPVIAVTANAMPHDIENGMAAGFNDYVIKPINVPEFLKLINLYLGS